MITSGLVVQKRARFEKGFASNRFGSARETEYGMVESQNVLNPGSKVRDGPYPNPSKWARPVARPQESTAMTRVRLAPYAETRYKDIFGKPKVGLQNIETGFTSGKVLNAPLAPMPQPNIGGPVPTGPTGGTVNGLPPNTGGGQMIDQATNTPQANMGYTTMSSQPTQTEPEAEIVRQSFATQTNPDAEGTFSQTSPVGVQSTGAQFPEFKVMEVDPVDIVEPMRERISALEAALYESNRQIRENDAKTAEISAALRQANDTMTMASSVVSSMENNILLEQTRNAEAANLNNLMLQYIAQREQLLQEVAQNEQTLIQTNEQMRINHSYEIAVNSELARFSNFSNVVQDPTFLTNTQNAENAITEANELIQVFTPYAAAEDAPPLVRERSTQVISELRQAVEVIQQMMETANRNAREAIMPLPQTIDRNTNEAIVCNGPLQRQPLRIDTAVAGTATNPIVISSPMGLSAQSTPEAIYAAGQSRINRNPIAVTPSPTTPPIAPTRTQRRSPVQSTSRSGRRTRNPNPNYVAPDSASPQ